MNEDALPTAAAAGYRMPAEWAPHERCWMAWPCRLDFWGDNIEATRRTYAEIANAISAFEPVTMLARPDDVADARRLCSSAVSILPTALDDSWTRDNGPNFVLNESGQLAASIFHFNAWGGKHVPWAKDAAIGHRIAEYLGVPTFSAPIFLEGGGINVDGEGTLLTTEQCVLHDNRNPGLSRDEAESILCEALGASMVIWLPGDPDDIETDGHIDGIACFLEPGKVLVEICPAVGTQRHDNMQRNVEALRGQKDAQGRELAIEFIEEAHEVDKRSEIFSCSYINFYLANDAVIMPAFGIDRDEDARGKLTSLFPHREIVQIDIGNVTIGGGGIHCITQQQPASTSS
jgi:agmatine deiminase